MTLTKCYGAPDDKNILVTIDLNQLLASVSCRCFPLIIERRSILNRLRLLLASPPFALFEASPIKSITVAYNRSLQFSFFYIC